MVVAEDAAAAGEGVLVQCAGPLTLAPRGQVEGEVVSRVEGVGVVAAEDPAAAGEGVLIQCASPLTLTLSSSWTTTGASSGTQVEPFQVPRRSPRASFPSSAEREISRVKPTATSN